MDYCGTWAKLVALRLLKAILERGLAPDERTARGLILAGRVRVNGKPLQHEGREVDSRDALEIVPTESPRGARKLGPVLELLQNAGQAFDIEGRVCADLGCSAGGFTQLLLERGAARVYAVDVAYGVLALPLRNNPRVVLLERTNARLLTQAEIDMPLERVVGDLSFISWGAVLPAIIPLLAPEARLLLLVKPQFELAAQGRGRELHSGIASSQQAQEVLAGLHPTWQANSLSTIAVMAAAIAGSKGNQEYFVLLQRGAGACGFEAYLDMVSHPIGVSA